MKNLLQVLRAPLTYITIVSTLLVFQVDVGHRLTDTFHEGEYLGLVWHMLSYYEGISSYPIVIHGAMDFIPSIVSKIIFGEESIIVGTRIVNSYIILVSWILFLHICWKIVESSSWSIFWMFVPIAAILLNLSKINNSVALQQAFIGVRDLFIIVMLWSMVCFAESREKRYRYLYIALMSMAVVCAAYWSYDRGVMASFAAFGLLIFLLYERDYRGSIWMAMVVILTVALFEYTLVSGSILDLIRNIGYWIANSSEIWSHKGLYPITLQALMLPMTLVTMLPLLAGAIKKDFLRDRKRIVAVIVLIVIIEILMIKTIFNRPGGPRTTWGLWPLTILFLYGASRFIDSVDAVNPHVSRLMAKANSVVFIWPVAFGITAVLDINASISSLHGVSQFVKYNIRPPRDRYMVESDVQAVANVLRESKSSCMLDWTNEGVMALLARLPKCTNFSYAVYSSVNYQEIFVEQLLRNPPRDVIYGSPSFSISIDGIPMARRLPQVESLIDADYPYSFKLGGYVIRSKAQSLGLH